MPSTTMRSSNGAIAASRTAALVWSPSATASSASWARVGSHSASRGMRSRPAANSRRRVRAPSTSPSWRWLRADTAYVPASSPNTWSAFSSISSAASVSRPSTRRRTQRWVRVSMVAFTLSAIAPSASASAHNAADSSTRPAIRARMPRHSGTYQRYSGSRMASAEALNIPICASTSAISPSSSNAAISSRRPSSSSRRSPSPTPRATTSAAASRRASE